MFMCIRMHRPTCAQRPYASLMYACILCMHESMYVCLCVYMHLGGLITFVKMKIISANIVLAGLRISRTIPSYHFLPPGVACTTGFSHNPFTWIPL